ncbi:nuclear receptor corepressor 2 [Phlyctochytrium bullatum]|nr:nuclear receptor corepressor 2 [Phlyctochytrium bullatum]
MDAWKKRSDKLELKAKKKKETDTAAVAPVATRPPAAPENANVLTTTSTTSRLFRRNQVGLISFTSDSVKSEAEWQEVLAMIAAKEAGPASRESLLASLCAKDSVMLLNPVDRSIFTFRNFNNKVDDPDDRLRKENSEMDMKWSLRDREEFKLRITQFGKNFPKIASHIGTKSTQDCIEYYYRQKYTCGFKQLLRRGGPGRGVKRKNASAALTRKTAILAKHPEISLQGKTRASLLGKSDLADSSMPENQSASVNADVANREVELDYESEDLATRKRPRLEETLAEGLVALRSRRRSAKEIDPSPADSPKDDLTAQAIRWNVDEKGRALEAFSKFGRDFNAVAEYVGSKRPVDCEHFYETYKVKLRLDDVIDAAENSKDNNNKKKLRKTLKKPEKKDKPIDSIASIPESYKETKPETPAGFITPDAYSGLERLDARSNEEDLKASDPDEQDVAQKGISAETEGDEAKKAKKKRNKRKNENLGAEAIRVEEEQIEVRNSGIVKPTDFPSPLQPIQKSKTVSYWSRAEKEEFVKAIQTYGLDWDQVAKTIGSKSAVQSRNHYHNFKDRNNYDEIVLSAGHQLPEDDTIISNSTDLKLDEDEEPPRKDTDVSDSKMQRRNADPTYEKEDVRYGTRTSTAPLADPPSNSYGYTTAPNVRKPEEAASQPQFINARPLYNQAPAAPSPFHQMYGSRDSYMHFPNSQDYPGASYTMVPYMDVIRGPQGQTPYAPRRPPPPGHYTSATPPHPASKPGYVTPMNQGPRPPPQAPGAVLHPSPYYRVDSPAQHGFGHAPQPHHITSYQTEYMYHSQPRYGGMHAGDSLARPASPVVHMGARPSPQVVSPGRYTDPHLYPPRQATSTPGQYGPPIPQYPPQAPPSMNTHSPVLHTSIPPIPHGTSRPPSDFIHPSAPHQQQQQPQQQQQQQQAQPYYAPSIQTSQPPKPITLPSIQNLILSANSDDSPPLQRHS